ncbi:MAG: PEP-CTERM sorting domain-containing protein, partial [Dechloromonas sp.]|nr:PEP-CTERM sorting domain-containing protein [Dechloromonas sp.]
SETAYSLRGSIDSVTIAATPVPEPETYAMLLVGLGMLGWKARRRG